MLLNGGELDGVRILSPKTIELMTVNHLDEGVTSGFGERPGAVGTFGPYPLRGQFKVLTYQAITGAPQ